MNPETVYDLLVAANPVPDRNVEAKSSSAFGTSSRPREPWSEPMQTIEPDLIVTPTEEPPSRRRWIAAAAAAAFVALAITAGLLASNRDDDQPVITSDDADQSEDAAPAETAEAARIDAALSVASTYHATFNAGDVDGLVALSNPDYTNVTADRAMYEMNAVIIAANGPWTIGECRSTDVTSLFVEVECDVVVSDPVFETLGLAELRSPLRVFDDGTVTWVPFRGVDFGLANGAVSDYLREYDPVGYEAVCSPAAYETGSVNSDRGLALTQSCAELWAPLATDIATWIDEGRPEA